MKIIKENVIDYMIRKHHLQGCEYAQIDTEILYEKAKQEILNTLFPFKEVKEIPEKYSMKIYDVMEEMMLRSNMGNATSYKENGIQITWENGELQSLKNLIPNGGVI